MEPSKNSSMGQKRKNDEEKEVEEKTEEREISSQPKKHRLIWTAELHQQFVEAVDFLGDEAVPKKIIDVMKKEGLTRNNVSSHLQKYRMYKNPPEKQQRRRTDVPNAPDRSSRSITATEGLDARSLAASSQNIYPGGRRGIASGMSFMDQFGITESSYNQMMSEALSNSSHPQSSRGSRQPRQIIQPSGYGNIRFDQQSSDPVGSNGIDFMKIGQPKQMVQPFGCRNIQFDQWSSGPVGSNGIDFRIIEQPQHIIQPSGCTSRKNIQFDHHSPGPVGSSALQSNSPFSGNAYNGRINKFLSMQMTQFPPSKSASMYLPGQPHSKGHAYRNPLTIGEQQMPIPAVSGGIRINPNTFAANCVNNSSYNTVPRALQIDDQSKSLADLFSNTNAVGLIDNPLDYNMFSENFQKQDFDWKNSIYQLGQPDGGSTNTSTVTQERISVPTENGQRTVESGQNNHTIDDENCVREQPEGMPDGSYEDKLFNNDVSSDDLRMNMLKEQEEALQKNAPEYNFEDFKLDK